MTEAEQLRSEVRELKMRLREIRTENAELKLQQKRWLALSAGVSILSLVLAVMMFIVSGDIKIERQGLGSNTGSQVYALDPKIETPEPPLPVPVPQPIEAPEIKEPEQGSFLDAPDLGLDIEAPPAPKPEIIENTAPSRGGAFELPGSNSGPKKKVIQYTVKKNDTLWNIAKNMMGSSKSSNIRKIMKDNGLVSSRLDPGMKLVIIVDQ